MLALAFFLSAGATAIAPAGEAPRAAPVFGGEMLSAVNEDELLLYSVQLDSLTLTDGLTAYGVPADPLLPLGELARLLDLDLDVSPADRRVTGRIGQAAQALTIDLATGTATLGGSQIALAPDDVAVTQTEIYVRASKLGRIIPARFDVDGESLSVAVVPTEALPIQSRLERIARLRQAGQPGDSREDVPFVESPYEFFSAPSFDVVLEAGSNNRAAPLSRRFEVRTAGDLFYTGMQGFVGSDDRGRPSDARLTLESRSLAGKLLGPLRATRVSGGDVFTPTLPLGPRSIAGRGVSLSTAPLQQLSVFDTVDLRGELPAGYDVELYVNDVLRNGQRSPVQGRYEFLDVPLVRGINVIRLSSYGPRGQRADQVRIVNVGGGQLKKGEATFEFGLVEQDRSLIDLSPGREVGPGVGDVRLVGNAAFGLSSALTLVAGASVFTTPLGDRRQVVTAGLRTSVAGLALRGDTGLDRGGGKALSVGIAGRPFGVSTLAEHFEYRSGFADENRSLRGVGEELVRHSNITADFNLPAFGAKTIPVMVRASRETYVGGASETSIGVRTSMTLSNVLLSTSVDYLRSKRRGAAANRQLGGVLAASTFLDYKWQLRGMLDYDISPGATLRSLGLTADRSLSDRIALRLGLTQLFTAPRATNLQAGANLRLPFGDIAMTGEFSLPGSDWSIGLRYALGFAFDRAQRSYRLTPPGPTSGGSAAVSSFLDTNANGRRDAGEIGVAGVSVEGGERPAATDAQGRAFVVGTGTASIAQLRFGTDNIDNLYVSAPPRSVEFSPRPGKVVELSYPLVPTGEIMAKLTFERDGEAVGLSAVRVRLVAETGFAKDATTEFDGTAVFGDLPAGRYRLELDPEQARRLKMRLAAPATVTVLADGEATPDLSARVVFEPAPSQGEPEQ